MQCHRQSAARDIPGRERGSCPKRVANSARGACTVLPQNVQGIWKGCGWDTRVKRREMSSRRRSQRCDYGRMPGTVCG